MSKSLTPRPNPFRKTDLQILEEMDPWPTSAPEVRRKLGWGNARAYDAMRELKIKHPELVSAIRRRNGLATIERARESLDTDRHRKHLRALGDAEHHKHVARRKRLYDGFIALPKMPLADAAAELFTSVPTLKIAIRENEGKHE